MKFIVVLLLAFPVLTLAQSEKKIRLGTDVKMTHSTIELSKRIENQFGISLISGRQQLRLASVIQTYSSEAVNNPEGWQFTGMSLGYHYNLPTLMKQFTMHFRYEFTLQYYENEWTGTFFEPSQNDYIDYKYESKEFFSGNTIGYGFSFNITKGLYIASEISAGVYFSDIKGERESTPVPTNVRIDFRGYDGFGFLWKAGATIGYNF